MPRLATAALCCLLPVFLLDGTARACTSLCFDTPDGPVFATNLDLGIPGDGYVFVNLQGIAKEGYLTSTTGETAKWTSRYGSVSFNLLGREFVWSGMNEAGLVVSSMALEASELPEADERAPLAISAWVQYVLDTCGSVQEAIQVNEFVRVQDDSSPDHYLVADADGDCAAIEYLDGRFVYYTGEDLPVKALSNLRYARALAAYERGGPRWWWSNPGRSAERFAGAAARMESFAADRDTCAVTHAFETLTRVVVAPQTKWNIVYDLAEREIWFRSVANPTVKNLSLDSFDYSCDSPFLMLDIDAALEGNVAEAFSPYDQEVNRQAFQTFLDRWEAPVSAEDARGLMRFFDGFECAP